MIYRKQMKQMEKESLSKQLGDIFIFMLTTAIIAIIVALVLIKTGLRDTLYLKASTYIVNNSIDNYEIRNDKYNYLYYDKTVSKREQEEIENIFNKISFLKDEILENDLRIIFSENTIEETIDILGKKIVKINLNNKDETIGVYIPHLKLIVIDLYDIDDVYNILLNNLESIKSENYKPEELVVQILADTSNKLNRNIILHELGHFLEDIVENNLEVNDEFIEVYENEKDKIYKKETQAYYRDNIREYIAESIAKVLEANFTNIKDDYDFCSSKTYDFISKKINSHK